MDRDGTRRFPLVFDLSEKKKKKVTTYFDVRHHGDSKFSTRGQWKGYLNCPPTFFFFHSSLDSLLVVSSSHTPKHQTNISFFTFIKRKMLFFRTISLVATLAFATLSSAVPVEGAGLVVSGDVFARDVSELAPPLKRNEALSLSAVYDNYNEIFTSISIDISQYIILLP